MNKYLKTNINKNLEFAEDYYIEYNITKTGNWKKDYISFNFGNDKKACDSILRQLIKQDYINISEL